MAILHLSCPSRFGAERAYAANTLCRHLLGIEAELAWADRQDYVLTLAGSPRQLAMPDAFFSVAPGAWLGPASLPKLPLERWSVHETLPEARLVEPRLPVIAGCRFQDGAWFAQAGDESWYLGLDVVGSVFFMLSRYEELIITMRDLHGRFPAESSLAVAEAFLERPILDEYAEVLFAAIERIWPGLTKPEGTGRILPTCDVDHPYDPSSRSVLTLLRKTGGDLLRRRDVRTAARRLRSAPLSRRKDYSWDVNNTFAWMMEACDERGLRMVFYFIAGHSGGAIDGTYSLSEPFLQDLLRTIHARGHEIGMHASYNTFRDADLLALERAALSRACESAGVSTEIRGNRQHYLRWDSAVTPGCLDAAGFEYDSTGSFADRAGFRFGTAHAFPMWDWKHSRESRLTQRPLILMESSVIATRYQGLGYSDASLANMIRLRDRSLKYGGDFRFLWHNTHLTRREDRRFFTTLLTPR